MDNGYDQIVGAMKHARAVALADEIFDSTRPEAIIAAIDSTCEMVCDSRPAKLLFVSHSSAICVGVTLQNGDSRFLKFHRPTCTHAFLSSVQAVQRVLAADGFPSPLPFGEPVPAVSGYVTVEQLMPGIPPESIRDAQSTYAIASALHRLAVAAAPLVESVVLPVRALPDADAGASRLWPEPNSPVVDYDAVADRAKWIDDFARRALEQVSPSRSKRVFGNQTPVARAARFLPIGQKSRAEESGNTVQGEGLQTLTKGPRQVKLRVSAVA